MASSPDFLCRVFKSDGKRVFSGSMTGDVSEGIKHYLEKEPIDFLFEVAKSEIRQRNPLT